MAGNVYSWSTTAATNATADTDINWAEGQLPGTVNDSARALMAGVAGLLKDNNATLTTGGSANAHTVTSNIAIAALATGLRLRLKAGFTNTSACTLNLTPAGGAAFGAKAIKVFRGSAEADPVAGAIVAGAHYIFEYDAAANAAAGAWILLNSSSYVARTPPQVFTSSGTYTPSAGLISAVIECLGGGGGGGGAAASGATDGCGGGGGGGGGYSRKYVTAAQVGASQTVTIGAAGTAGSAGANNGGAGGTTSVGTLCVANGGSGGSGAIATSGQPGGTGATAGTGDVAGQGATGGAGMGLINVTTTASRGGCGASSFLGGGGADVICVTSLTGNAGTGFGAGGGGGASFQSGAAAAGGAGTAGIVFITEYVS